jgi:hypothetical protein
VRRGWDGATFRCRGRWTPPISGSRTGRSAIRPRPRWATRILTFFVDDLDAVDVARWAPAIQRDPLLPEQANVGVAQMLNAETIALSVWERPGILTAACGTGACAAAVAAVRRGYSDAKRFRVVMRGGTVEITLAEDGSVRMEGEVAVSFAGRAAVTEPLSCYQPAPAAGRSRGRGPAA